MLEVTTGSVRLSDHFDSATQNIGELALDADRDYVQELRPEVPDVPPSAVKAPCLQARWRAQTVQEDDRVRRRPTQSSL